MAKILFSEPIYPEERVSIFNAADGGLGDEDSVPPSDEEGDDPVYDLSCTLTSLSARRGHEATHLNLPSAVAALKGGAVFDALVAGSNGRKLIEVAQGLDVPPRAIVFYTNDRAANALPGVITLDKGADSIHAVFRRIHEALGIAVHSLDEEERGY